MKKTATIGFLRNAGMGFAGLCFAGLLAVGTGCLPAASNDTGSGGGSSNSSSNSSGGGGNSSSSSSSSSSGGSSSSSSSSSSSGGGGSSSSSASSSKGGSSSSSSSSSGGGGSSSSSSSSSSASGGGGSSATTPPPGGSTGSTPSGTTVTFTNGKATGAMTGYGWVAFGSADPVTSPTCGTEKITAGCAATTWSTKDSLCITASIPALPATPAATDYSTNWGVMVGVDATDAKGSLGQSLASVTIATSGTPTSGLRAKLHLKGDAEGSDYCAAYTTGAIAFTSFTKTCYDTTSPGTAVTAADVTKIDQIGLQVPSGSAAISVSSLCITGITFK